MSMEPIVILKEARKLLSDPKRWTTKHYARDASGKSTREIQNATCWCALGAIAKVGGLATPVDAGIVLADPVLSIAATYLRKAMYGNIATFNDTQDHGDILAAFDKAIKKLETAKA